MKLAIITGASRGIGYATAKRLNKNDYQVVNISRTKADGVESYKTDIRSCIDIADAFNRVVEKYGKPDVLINCAGYVKPQGILEISYNEWKKTIDVNLTGVFLCTQVFVQIVKDTGGKIINIASTAGTRPQPGWSAYAAAKAGVINFSKTMAEELTPYGIKVYCIAPGRCATALRKKLAPDEDQRAIMQPDELAETISYIVENDILAGNLIVAKKGGSHYA